MRYRVMGYGLWVIIILIFAIALFGCQKKERVRSGAAAVIPVRAMEVKFKTLYESLDYIGDIKAQDEAVVYPKVSGKLSEKLKEDGSSVNKGDIIAYIDRDEVGLKFEKAPVESPLAGVIGRIYADKGVSVTAQTPIALVVSMDKVKINFAIPEKYLPRVFLNQEAKITVDAYPEDEFSGRVDKISPVVDLETRCAPVEITVDNQAHRLKPGMFAKVSLIIAEHKNAPVILKEAVMGSDPDFYVYVAQNSRAILKKVALGIRQGAYFEVKSGLKEGETVVIMGQQKLYDGASVSVEQAGGL